MRRAFTLVELVVVLVIISALAGLALPAYGGAVARYRLDAAAYDLSAELDRAAAHARATGTTVTIRFDTLADVVNFDDLPERSTGVTSFALDLREDPRNAGFVSVNFSGAEDYSISGYGIPSSGGTIVLRNSAAMRQIEVNASTGRTRVTR